MVQVDFEYLINLIVPNIARKNSICRAAVPVEERLAVLLVGRISHRRKN
jgi:hypothetical protein